jgi:hypothetical protein
VPAPIGNGENVKRLLDLILRGATWPIAALGLVAWLALLYLMVGDIL